MPMMIRTCDRRDDTCNGDVDGDGYSLLFLVSCRSPGVCVSCDAMRTTKTQKNRRKSVREKERKKWTP